MFHGQLSKADGGGGALCQKWHVKTKDGKRTDGLMMPCPICESNKHVCFKECFVVSSGRALHSMHGPLVKVGRKYVCHADHTGMETVLPHPGRCYRLLEGFGFTVSVPPRATSPSPARATQLSPLLFRVLTPHVAPCCTRPLLILLTLPPPIPPSMRPPWPG